MNNQIALVDTNILVYAINSSSPFCLQAQQFLEKTIPSKTLAITTQNLTELYSIVTNKKAFSPPFSSLQAQKILQEILVNKDYQLLLPTRQTPSILLSLLKQYPAKGAEIHDVHLAAVMIDHGVSTIYTADTSVFKRLKLNAINPFI